MDRPETYGRWWNTNELDETWYRSIFDVRTRAHAFFLDWVGSLHRQQEPIETVLEVGCGRGEPYAKIFNQYDYHGTDISQKEIEFCQQRYPERQANFFVADAIQDSLRRKYDLVFAHAVIDHVYDINLFLQKLAAASAGWLYVSCYRGWHPRLANHKYEWLEGLRASITMCPQPKRDTHWKQPDANKSRSFQTLLEIRKMIFHWKPLSLRKRQHEVSLIRPPAGWDRELAA